MRNHKWIRYTRITKWADDSIHIYKLQACVRCGETRFAADEAYVAVHHLQLDHIEDCDEAVVARIMEQ